MDTSHLVFRTVYVDPDVDAALRAQAASEGVGKGQMFRRYLEEGLRQATKGRRLPQFPCPEPRLVMRTVYLPVHADERLTGRAYALRASKSDLLRQCLRLGMRALSRENLR